MEEFEVTCKVTKGERDIAYGEDCYCYYTQPNYNERIVRCKDCKHFAHAGTRNLGTNKTTHDACRMLSTWDSEYDFTEWWYTKPDGFCAWGERRDDA